jgi:hypothetical protein
VRFDAGALAGLLLFLYLLIGRVFVFISRKGIARTWPGVMVATIGWPILVLVMFGLVVVEMVSTKGEGYEDE